MLTITANSGFSFIYFLLCCCIILFFQAQSIGVCYPLATALYFDLYNPENECSLYCQDSKERAEIVIMFFFLKSTLMCMLVCLLVFVQRGTRMVPQCFMVLHENKCEFNYNGVCKCPRTLVYFCSVSGRSGFGDLVSDCCPK